MSPLSRRLAGTRPLALATLWLLSQPTAGPAQQLPAPLPTPAPAPGALPAQPPAPAAGAAVRTPLPGQPSFAPVPADAFSPALGIYYQFVPYGQSWGARLTRDPVAGSPMRQIQLEPGDTIVALDGQWIQGPQDLESHVHQTAVDLINVRTNQLQRNWVMLGGGVPPPPPPPPQPPYPPYPPVPPYPPAPGPRYVLGVTTVAVTVAGGVAAAAPAVPGAPYTSLRPIGALRIVSVSRGSAAERAGLEVGDTILTANNRGTAAPTDLLAALAESNGVVQLTVRSVRGGFDRTVVAYPTPIGGVYASPVPGPAGTPAPAPGRAPRPRSGQP